MRITITPETYEEHKPLVDGLLKRLQLDPRDVASVTINDSVAVITKYLRNSEGHFFTEDYETVASKSISTLGLV